MSGLPGESVAGLPPVFFLVARVHGPDGCSETRIRVLNLAELIMNVFLVQCIAVIRVF